MLDDLDQLPIPPDDPPSYSPAPQVATPLPPLEVIQPQPALASVPKPRLTARTMAGKLILLLLAACAAIGTMWQYLKLKQQTAPIPQARPARPVHQVKAASSVGVHKSEMHSSKKKSSKKKQHSKRKPKPWFSN